MAARGTSADQGSNHQFVRRMRCLLMPDGWVHDRHTTMEHRNLSAASAHREVQPVASWSMKWPHCSPFMNPHYVSRSLVKRNSLLRRRQHMINRPAVFKLLSHLRSTTAPRGQGIKLRTHSVFWAQSCSSLAVETMCDVSKPKQPDLALYRC